MPIGSVGNIPKQNGFSLVEVLVASAIAVIALLGLGLAQVKALQYAQSSFQYTIATIEANNAAERLWPELCDIATNAVQFPAVVDQIEAQAQAPGYTLIMPNAFNTDFNIQVSWQDERLDVGIASSVSLFPQYPTLDAGNC